MSELLVLGSGVVLLWVLLIILRVPALALFLSIFAGHLLATEASSEAYEFIGSLLRVPQYYYVQVGLFALPVLLSILFLKGKLTKSKLMIEALPLLFASLLLVTLLYPLIPALQASVIQAAGGQIANYKVIIISAACLSALLSLWLTYPSHSDKRSGHKKH